MFPPNSNQVFCCANPEQEAVLPQTSNVTANAFFDPGADAILTQPSSLKAKFYNSFGARNWVNEIPACGWKMHRQQHEAAGARSMGLCLERHLVIYLQDKTAALSWSPPTGCEADKGRAVLVGDPL
ncbi:hypothetical protein N5938_03935 [Pseudomonas aeruginosa]|uniref:hypothetical protein n=1 Tax=Pseudomonas aeruginosa TaxID=287 RepID=UPI0021F0CBF0|nr:hypothetical protein [Pseudomonas aeruginosa]UYM62094.1 hypothetical protein N5938_03935 [Pseudomonas aeruginosa]